MSIQLTPKAVQRIGEQLAERGHGLGLRLKITKTGCSGFGYRLDFADSVEADERVFETDGARVVVAEKDLELLDGLTIDFVRDGLNRLYRFENPNARALCGCGESFTV